MSKGRENRPLETGGAGEGAASNPQGSTHSNSYGPHLLPQHAALLEASAISSEVAEARGYRSVETKADLERKGFARPQRSVPGLLIPIYDVTGECATYQYRPDVPRKNAQGKPVKYETRIKSRMVVDVPPAARQWLGDPKHPLWITEGSRKADAAVSKGLCCIALLGVYNYRGTNEHGGKTALPDWEAIALNDREVLITFDSDAMTKSEVYGALARLKAFLEQRGANVRIVYLPSGEGGVKTGLDDYLADGHGVDDLLALATTELRRPPGHENDGDGPYRDTPGGLLWLKTTRDGPAPTMLTNFTAKIIADVIEDDGVELRRRFEVEAAVNGRIRTFTIPAAQFQGMGWATEHLGAGAIVYPGFGAKDHARAAVQHLSGDVPERRVYTHTGWLHVDRDWVYLHAGGAIGIDGAADLIDVALPGPLARYELPPPPEGDELVTAIRASLRMLDLAPHRITVPLFATCWRATLGPGDLSVHVAGPTGAAKSELAALVQQHYGAGMDRLNLPASWSSTGNALEGIAFHAKDAVLVVDDFAPTGATGDVQRYHRDADRLMRAQGNQAGRARMRADSSLRPTKSPRGLTVSTGEDVPRGQSLRARTLVLEIGPDDIDWDALTRCQKDAAGGLYAQAMAGYLRWLAPEYDRVPGALREIVSALRTRATASATHRRTPEMTANLAAGLDSFLDFARDAGAVTAIEADELKGLWWKALGDAALEQSHHQAASEPAQRFVELVSAAVGSGKAHIAKTDGTNPSNPGSLGWRLEAVGVGQNERTVWRPQRERIGWLDGDNLYLQPSAAFESAQRLAQGTGDPLTVTSRTLHKRLSEQGLLRSTEPTRKTLTVRQKIEGRRQSVLHLHIDVLSTHTGPDQPDQQGDTGEPGQVSGSSSAGRPDQEADQDDEPEMPAAVTRPRSDGQVGQLHDGDEEQFGETGGGVVTSFERTGQKPTTRLTSPAVSESGSLEKTCVHRPAGEAGRLWDIPEARGDDAKVCRCCEGPTRGALANTDGICPTCRSGRPAPMRGGHVARFALDLGAALIQQEH